VSVPQECRKCVRVRDAQAGTGSDVKHWNLREIETPGGSRSPAVQDPARPARALVIGLEPGQQLGEHEVKEHAFQLVVDGTVRIEAGNETIEAAPGMLFFFEPEERGSVSTRDGARLLLFLAPWPGLGHYRGDERGAAAT
jgi:quercetin dioxygenase-like cupin family protein